MKGKLLKLKFGDKVQKLRKIEKRGFQKLLALKFHSKKFLIQEKELRLLNPQRKLKKEKKSVPLKDALSLKDFGERKSKKSHSKSKKFQLKSKNKGLLNLQKF
jgi:hypothetical protein